MADKNTRITVTEGDEAPIVFETEGQVREYLYEILTTGYIEEDSAEIVVRNVVFTDAELEALAEEDARA